MVFLAPASEASCPAASGAVAAASWGASRSLTPPEVLRGIAVSVAWRVGLEEALGAAKDLDLHGRDVDDKDVASIVRLCPLLRRINLCGCKRVTDSALLAVAHACPALVDLNLTGSRSITVAGVDEVVRCCSSLEALGLADCPRIPENVLMGRYAKLCDLFDEEVEGPWAA
eukprot:gnl/TRDRNA2_/TRDRNA2_83651_c0_seq1.p1 gnl/TRDRNA2_/TRDRNA2_83651_c0~~gnl/TRDRNA2_/TRDRNA2_83651_c0_seq1.p1  ORF type:complete len:180 (+),score=32.77 gnl/TRDRNA2_/TRDRNA2_83651_c0_seq1:30-542(+)